MTGDGEPGDLDAREAARIRRRDREAEAKARELMRPGMGKVFKQILDVQAKAAKGAKGAKATKAAKQPAEGRRRG